LRIGFFSFIKRDEPDFQSLTKVLYLQKPLQIFKYYFQEGHIDNHESCINHLQLILKNQQREVLKKKKVLQEIKEASSSTQRRISRLFDKKAKLRDYMKNKKVLALL